MSCKGGFILVSLWFPSIRRLSAAGIELLGCTTPKSNSREEGGYNKNLQLDILPPVSPVS